MDASIIDMMLGQATAGDPGAARVIKAELERLRGMETRAREMRDCPRATGLAGVHQRGTARYILGEA